MKRTTKYTNRYGDDYTFTMQEDGSVLWEGPFDYYRVVYDPDIDSISAVDPSGGPFIQVGLEMRYLNLPNRISKLEWIQDPKAVKIMLE